MLCWTGRLKGVIRGLALMCLGVTVCSAQAPESAPVVALSGDPLIDLTTVDWIHGAQDCDAEQRRTGYTEWQQVRYQEDT